jgi:hypothetical protein
VQLKPTVDISVDLLAMRKGYNKTTFALLEGPAFAELVNE